MDMKCYHCKDEDHEGHFCRCESRNIQLSKYLREIGKSPWMKNSLEPVESVES